MKDLQKLFAIQAQNKEKTLPEGTQTEYFKVPYLDHNGEKKEVNACIYFPEGKKPYPLVYVSHYKITPDAAELAGYLKEGWAVACQYEEKDPNEELTRDGLVSNSAVIWNLRNRPEIDETRIAITGGSAGGYMGMMLSALHLTGCATIVRGAFSNVYFNFKHYAPYTASFNMGTFLKLKQEGETDLMKLLSKLPIPFAIVFNTFGTGTNPELDARLGDLETAKAVSPTMLAGCLSNPLLETHNTSDILVPVDQITRSFTYPHVGSDLPSDYKIHLNDFEMPEELNKSFVEMLPEGSYTERLLPLVPEGETEDLPFDEKPFQIDIYDEKEPQSYGSHGTGLPQGYASDIAYLKRYMKDGNVSQFLTKEKAVLLLERYAGISMQLPAHDGNPDIYGSRDIYQKEVTEELLSYAVSHPEEDICEKLMEAARTRAELKKAAEKCCEQIRKAAR